MLLAILADIHGNLPALEAVLEDMRLFPVDQILIAGDIASGPQVNECVQLLQQVNCLSILGNNEQYMLSFSEYQVPSYWWTLQQYGLARWSYQNLSADSLSYFRSLPSQLSIRLPGVAPLRLVHGSTNSPSESIFPDTQPEGLENALASIDEAVFICGHTHIPWQKMHNGKLAINPGAVSGSLNGDPRAQYKLLTWNHNHWQVTPRQVGYNLKHVRQRYQESGLLDAGGGLVLGCLHNIETGKNVSQDFLEAACRFARQNGVLDCRQIPDNIWQSVTKTFPWPLKDDRKETYATQPYPQETRLSSH